jgi:hypothetical protein
MIFESDRSAAAEARRLAETLGFTVEDAPSPTGAEPTLFARRAAQPASATAAPGERRPTLAATQPS